MDRSRGSSGEPDSLSFRSHSRGNFPKSEEVPRRRISVNDGPGLLPNPDQGLLPSPNPSYPPGFDNTRRSPSGFDDCRISPPGNAYRNASGFDNHRSRSGFDRSRSGCDRSRSGFDNIHRNRSGFDNEMMVQESPDIPSDRPFRGAPNSFDQDCNAPEASPAVESMKKRKKPGAQDAQRPSPAASDFDRTNKVCHKLWKDLDVAIQQRERDLRDKEERFTPSTINKEVLEEEKKQTAAMKNDVMEERRRLDEEAQRVRKEKDALERTSTELAVQMVELKQVQRQLEKEKAALVARKAESSAKQRCSQEQDNAITDTPLVAVKAEIEGPVTNLCTSGSDAAPNNIQNQEPEADIPVASNRNLEPAKVELATSE